MPTIALVTDSTAYLPPERVRQYGVHVVPLYIHFGEETYRDRVDLDFDCRELFIVPFSPAIATHVGPGTVGVAFYAEEMR